MQKIQYRKGDASYPSVALDRRCIIPHIVNARGKWGRGFVTSLSARWPRAEQAYRDWHASQRDWEMGAVQFVPVAPRWFVANMLCMAALRGYGNPTPLSYPAFVVAWHEVVEYSELMKADLHFPKIGAGLAGGDWSKISEIIERDTPDVVGLFCYELLSEGK